MQSEQSVNLEGIEFMQRANGFNEFHSHMKRGGMIEYFVDRDGRPTINYPHVHVIHHGGGRVEIVASRSRGDHPWRTVVNDPQSNKGREIESAIRTAREKL